MPLRPPASRGQTWLLPPSLDELVPFDHPARFVAEFVDALDQATWSELEVTPAGDRLGAPAYHPRVVLGVWLYGFMTGVRSSRKLEAACRDQLPYLWLTGWQRPDHNTLWRFYQAHRAGMRALLRRTVRLAVRLGLVELAVQAVDGTRVMANAAKERTYDAQGLQGLLERTEAAIADLEAQNETGGDPPPPRLPKTLANAAALRARVQQAAAELAAESGPRRINLTDGDATLMKGRQGFVVGYNAQVMVAPVDLVTAGRTGLLITAAEVVTAADDHEALLPMIDAAAEQTGRAADWILADGGYHSGPNLLGCAERDQAVVMPEAQRRVLGAAYHKDSFAYDGATDSYTCPAGETLRFGGRRLRKGRAGIRVYRGSAPVCRGCSAFGQCTTNRRHGRILEIGPEEHALRAHRRWMATPEAKARYRQRKELPEPAFGILKEQQGARRFLRRGLAAVRSEWLLLATTFNLRTLSRLWQGRGGPGWQPGVAFA
jgi:transposase